MVSALTSDFDTSAVTSQGVYFAQKDLPTVEFDGEYFSVDGFEVASDMIVTMEDVKALLALALHAENYPEMWGER